MIQIAVDDDDDVAPVVPIVAKAAVVVVVVDDDVLALVRVTVVVFSIDALVFVQHVL